MRDANLATRLNLVGSFSVSAARKYLQNVIGRDRPGQATTQKQLLVDVSVIIANDARTGIQRVVRALLLQLLQQPPAGYQVRPVFANRKNGYRYAPDLFSQPNPHSLSMHEADSVKVQRGDVFLGLDLAAHILPRHKAQLGNWKRVGVYIHIFVYDLLPLLYPQWFNPKTSKNFLRWTKTLAVFADSIICISHTVKDQIDGWLLRRYKLPPGTIPIHVVKLGSDIQASAPSHGLPADIDGVMGALFGRRSLLMVGTVEPRKGHDQVLDAFSELWRLGCDVNLIIVGKPGWKTQALQKSLRSHPELHKHLHWFEDASAKTSARPGFSNQASQQLSD